ncbi:MAG: SulP family inorganic anion transporter [Verrucomicrobiaceae bacterium]|nr:SulP family inorganic anion transporter [Verrucomicrobiaceae bacterium]
MTFSPREWLAGVRHTTQRVVALTRHVISDSALDPFPLRRALLGYGRRTFRSDLRAGATVAMIDIPQGMAYALIAGLPLHYGITCSAVAAIIGPLLASSRQTILGPTNATAFMVFSYFAAYPQLDRVSMMPLLVFMTAALLLAGAFLRVADLTQYISRTVIVAYVTGAALLITASQLPVLLGIPMEVINGGLQPAITLPGHVFRILRSLGSAEWLSIACAASTLSIYLFLKAWKPRWPVFAITLVSVSLLWWGLGGFGVEVTTFKDATFTWRELLPVFPDFVSADALTDSSRLFGLALALAFLTTMETSVMARTLAGRAGHRVDQNQDMLSLGAANLACAYLSGMPASCSLTRSALNYMSGARTAFASMWNGVFCLVGALTLGSAVGHIPRPALAALVACVAMSLLNRRQIRICMRATRSDAVVFLVTLTAACMLPLHVAIFLGVGLSVILYLRKAARPQLIEYEFNAEGNLAEAKRGARQHPSISIVHVEGELFFGAAELFRTQIQRTFADPNLRIVILRLKNARHLDATSVLALEELLRILRADGRHLIISGASKDVYRVLKNSGLVDVVGRENIFLASAANPNLSTRNALKRAQEILGIKDAEVRIYFDPSKQAQAT